MGSIERTRERKTLEGHTARRLCANQPLIIIRFSTALENMKRAQNISPLFHIHQSHGSLKTKVLKCHKDKAWKITARGPIYLG